MNAARRAARAGRNLLIALTVGAVIIVAIVVAFMAGRGTSDPVAAPPSSIVVSGPATTATAAADSAPTGCLGGPKRTVDMLLGAQASARHTVYGAVEVASAFARWAYRFPFPTAAESRTISAALISPSATAGLKDIAGSFAAADDITGGQVAGATAFHLSTATGVWLLRPSSTTDQVTVELSAPYVIRGEVSATKSAATSTTLVWLRGKWLIESQQAPTASALAAGGTTFSAGC